MTVTFAHQNETRAPIVDLGAGKSEAKTAPGQANDEVTQPVEEGRHRRQTFLDFVRRALSALHV